MTDHKQDNLLAHSRQVSAQADEYLHGGALALPNEAEEQVLGADIVMAQLKGFTQGKLEDLLRAGVKGGDPVVEELAGWMVSATFSRTAPRSIPRDASALAATPSPSSMRPTRMCSVPMKP